MSAILNKKYFLLAIVFIISLIFLTFQIGLLNPGKNSPESSQSLTTITIPYGIKDGEVGITKASLDNLSGTFKPLIFKKSDKEIGVFNPVNNRIAIYNLYTSKNLEEFNLKIKENYNVQGVELINDTIIIKTVANLSTIASLISKENLNQEENLKLENFKNESVLWYALRDGKLSELSTSKELKSFNQDIRMYDLKKLEGEKFGLSFGKVGQLSTDSILQDKSTSSLRLGTIYFPETFVSIESITDSSNKKIILKTGNNEFVYQSPEALNSCEPLQFSKDQIYCIDQYDERNNLLSTSEGNKWYRLLKINKDGEVVLEFKNIVDYKKYKNQVLIISLNEESETWLIQAIEL
jgi:hypothetical protein